MLTGQCHCGIIKITLPSKPEKATICNCSLCRRIGAVWAYYTIDTVKIEGHPEQTQGYIQGDKVLVTSRCKACGMVTHYDPLDDHQTMAVNLRNFPVEIMQGVVKRRFDGADSWKDVSDEDTPRSDTWPF